MLANSGREEPCWQTVVERGGDGKHSYICAYMFIHVHKTFHLYGAVHSLGAHIYECEGVRIYTCIYMCMCIYIYIYMYMYVYENICIYSCICIYM